MTATATTAFFSSWLACLNIVIIQGRSIPCDLHLLYVNGYCALSFFLFLNFNRLPLLFQADRLTAFKLSHLLRSEAQRSGILLAVELGSTACRLCKFARSLFEVLQHWIFCFDNWQGPMAPLRYRGRGSLWEKLAYWDELDLLLMTWSVKWFVMIFEIGLQVKVPKNRSRRGRLDKGRLCKEPHGDANRGGFSLIFEDLVIFYYSGLLVQWWWKEGFTCATVFQILSSGSVCWYLKHQWLTVRLIRLLSCVNSGERLWGLRIGKSMLYHGRRLLRLLFRSFQHHFDWLKSVNHMNLLVES